MILVVLWKGNKCLIEVVKKTLEDFSHVSGLIHNLGKSIIVFGSIKERDKFDLLQVMPFKRGKLPLRYLGVPLLAKKLRDDTKVADMVVNGQRSWLDECVDKYPILRNFDISINLTEKEDKDKLLTQEKIKKWQNNGDLKGVFCKQCTASLYHLFIQCDVPNKVWNEMLKLAYKMENHDKFQEVINTLAGKSERKSIGIIVNKLAAIVYFIWQERNLRMFKVEEELKNLLSRSYMTM
ncbi:hypothetical protein Tco_0007409 [Tanacetum coccineum]